MNELGNVLEILIADKIEDLFPDGITPDAFDDLDSTDVESLEICGVFLELREQNKWLERIAKILMAKSASTAIAAPP